MQAFRRSEERRRKDGATDIDVAVGGHPPDKPERTSMSGNLDLYNAAAARMGPVDIIAVRSGVSDPIGHSIEVVSAMIEKVGESKGKPGYRHIAIVRRPLLAGRDVQIIESTIEAGANGVQTHALGATLAGYQPGSHADWYPLSAKSRARRPRGVLFLVRPQRRGDAVLYPGAIPIYVPAGLGPRPRGAIFDAAIRIF